MNTQLYTLTGDFIFSVTFVSSLEFGQGLGSAIDRVGISWLPKNTETQMKARLVRVKNWRTGACFCNFSYATVAV